MEFFSHQYELIAAPSFERTPNRAKCQTVGCFDLHQVACGTEKLDHHTCNSAKRTLAGACEKCYSLLVDTRVLSSIVGALAALVMLAFCRTLNAQPVTVLKNVNVIDGTGAAAQPHRIVVIEGDRIRSIAPEQTDTPSGAKAVDMHGRTIMPLIINTHGHLGMVKGTSSGVANQTEENFRHQLLRYQDYGIGAVLSMGTDGPKFAEIREASRTGKLPGADIYSAGNGFGAKDGAPPADKPISLSARQPTKSRITVQAT